MIHMCLRISLFCLVTLNKSIEDGCATWKCSILFEIIIISTNIVLSVYVFVCVGENQWTATNVRASDSTLTLCPIFQLSRYYTATLIIFIGLTWHWTDIKLVRWICVALNLFCWKQQTNIIWFTSHCVNVNVDKFNLNAAPFRSKFACTLPKAKHTQKIICL